MAAWRLVRSLDTLRTQVKAAAPRAAPPATPASAWGTIGDTAHDSTSDHAPHVYAALGPVPVVCAADFPHAPALGLDAGAFTEALRQSRDPRIAYVIFNGRIFSSTNTPWTWRTYTGSDQHREHWHVSTVHTGLADNASSWRMPGAAAAGSDTMSFNDVQKADAAFNNKATATLDTDGTPDGKGSLREFPNATHAAIEELRVTIASLSQQAGQDGTPASGGISEERAREIAREELARAAVVPGDAD